MNTRIRPEVLEYRIAGVTTTACAHHGCVHDTRDRVRTIANAITMVRSLGAHACILAAIATWQTPILMLGLAIQLVGDIADGAVARRRNEETLNGALLDIVCDRMFYATYYTLYAVLHPHMLYAAGIFLFSFMVLDAHLSVSFLFWPLKSVNYFYLVDLTIFWWNFSKFGKTLQNAPLLVAMIVIGDPAVATVVAIVLAFVKVFSLVRLHQIGIRPRPGCASAVTS